jgi:hypothetical protein
MRVTTVISLDVGAKTGWAILRKHDMEIIGCGDLLVDDLGCALDLIVRWLNLSGYTSEAVIEQMPSVGGVGELSTVLEYARKTTDYWLREVFQVPITYVLPGTWKNSRVANTTKLPKDWNGKMLSQHQKDAILMGRYYADRSDK